MRKLVFFVIYTPAFLLALYLFSDNILSRIYLRNNNTKLQAIVARVETKENNNLELLLEFIYDNKKHERKVIVTRRFIESYYIGKKITVLYNDERNLFYPNDNIDKSIFNGILFLIIILPLMCSAVIHFLVFYFIDNVKNKLYDDKKTKNTFEIYKQDREYNIVSISNEKIITPEIIMKKIDLYKLENNKLLCYGIGAGKKFVELYYNDQQYSIRISNKKDEYVENVDGDIIMKYYEKVMEEMGKQD